MLNTLFKNTALFSSLITLDINRFYVHCTPATFSL